MSTIPELAKQLSDAFVTNKRSDGAEFVHLADNSPQWMTDVIRAVHGDKLPDDTTYPFIERSANALADSDVTYADHACEVARLVHSRFDRLAPRAGRPYVLANRSLGRD
jgi:hypothetical protein